LALVDALEVNTSVTTIDIDDDDDEMDCARIDVLLARNRRLRDLFLFDARQMLLSVMCADLCGVLWPYLLEGDDTGGIVAPKNVDEVRAEFAAVVAERRRRELCRPVLVADVRAMQSETNDLITKQSTQIAEQSSQIVKQSSQIAALNDIVSGLASQNAEQTNQNAEQTNQIADLQRSTETIVKQNQQMQEQNQQMQEQMRQMHALLMSREQEPSANVDERDKRAVKRRRTDR